MAIEWLNDGQLDWKNRSNLQAEEAENQAEISDSIVSSMHFYGSKNIEKHFKTQLNITNENLKDAYVICAESDEEGHMLVEFHWIDKAIQILGQDENAKIILTSFLPKEYFIKNLWEKSKIFEKPNVVFFQIPEFDGINDIKFWNIDGKSHAEIIKVSINDFLKLVRHSSRNEKSWFYNEANKEKAEKYYNEFKNRYWSILPNCSYDEFVMFTINYIIDDELKMPWKEIFWVYCDIDWTLILTDENWEKKVNEKVLNYLKNLEELWKEIYIWTGWDVSEQRKILESFWITYPVLSKYDYSWASAEFIIDDFKDGSKFYAFYSITPKTYLNVSDIK